MPRRVFVAALTILCLLVLAASHGSEKDELAVIFPEISGWVRDGDPQIYEPDNLWEYIDGAAEVYLSYDFQKLATQSYDRDEKQSLTIDIYVHSNANNAFGIYSQEKPARSHFLPIGTQGYHEKGILNFFQGRYYVKLIGFHLGDGERSLIVDMAAKIAKRLNEKARFPKPLACFPERGKIENSERYIAMGFLGHGFLRSAFVADYEIEGEKKQLFIIEAADARKAETMLSEYLAYAGEKSIDAIDDEIYRFQDPQYSSSGTMNLMRKGKYIWGLFGDDSSISDFYIGEIKDNLIEHGLID
jgi:hypothetical protein